MITTRPLSAILWCLILGLSLGLVACKSDEADDLAKAQQCLDQVNPTTPEDAQDCLQYVKDYNSQQANIIRCSIYMTAGGLVETKVVEAYNLLKTSSGLNANNSAVFYSVLALDKPNKSAGLATAKLADTFCKKTGISSLISISSYIVVGSTLANLVPAADPATPQGQTDLANAIQSCTSNPLPAECAPEVVGPAVVAISESYCQSDAADARICSEVQNAISGGATPTEVGEAIYCYIANPPKAYDPVTKTCTP